jgi:hypothetical protein
MAKRKRKKRARATKTGEAHKTSSGSQPNQRARIYSNGVGELQVGAGTEPGDLDVHFELIVDGAPSKQPCRAIGFRVRASKLVLATLFVGAVLIYATIGHDREMVKDGLDFFRSVLTPVMHTPAGVAQPKTRDSKAK